MSLSSKRIYLDLLLNVYTVIMTLMCLVILQIYELEHEPYNLRNTELLFRGFYARAKTFNYTFFPRVVRSWNKLPISMKKSDSVSSSNKS